MNMSMEEMQEYIKLLEADLAKEKAAREEEQNMYKELETDYEHTIDSLRRELANANGKIISQNIILESYKDKVGTPVIVEGAESDLYKGEQKDFIIELIRRAMGASPKYTRNYRICESLLGANVEVGERARIKDTIANILKSYSGMTNDTISALNDIGIKVIDCKNHFKLVLAGDERYIVSISHSPSDVKCGLNATSDINRCFF